MTFQELGGHPSLLRALEAKGYAQPTPVQSAVLAPANAGRDLLVSSETGSGKTVAFGLALAPTLLGDRERFDRAAMPKALVLAPTRELAQQVQSELEWLYAPAGARMVACVGGMDMFRQLRGLKDGAHIVVGTPGRLCDHLDRGSLKLEALEALVLDEADEMLDMGFRDELERILRDAPTTRRTLLFSATIPKEIQELTERYQKQAVRIAATPPERAHRDIEYRAHLIAMREREHAVVNVLRSWDVSAAIVFVSTRDAVNHLHASLVERGFSAVALSGELTQAERTRALKALRDGRARVLVATDVAARGLDLPDVGLVVHADLPNDAQVLQHRSGRTGRAGRKGSSVLLVPAARRRAAERLLREAHVTPVWSPVPSAASIRAADAERIVKEISLRAAEVSEEDLEIARRLLADRPPEQIAALLVALERAKLAAPEDLPLTADTLRTTTSRPRPERPAGTFTPREGPSGRPSFVPRDPSAPRASFTPREERPHSASFTPGEARTDRPAPSRPIEGATWFSLNVGRETNADPKWLVPLLCRRGAVTKADIGAIRIMATETRVEITPKAAERFAVAVRRPDKQDKQIRIVPSSPPPAGPGRPMGGARPPRRPPRGE